MQNRGDAMDQPAPALQRGVNLIGFNRAEIGLGESVRLAASSLQSAKVPFGILNFPFPLPCRMGDVTWAHKEIGGAVHNINLFHMNPDRLGDARGHFGESLWRHRYNIGYWHWELPDFPDEDVYAFRFVQEVWTPATFVFDSVSKKANVPVVRMPHGIELDVDPALTRDTFGLPHGRFLFIVMFDVQSHTPRKNPQGAIEAFKLAFASDDPNVGLILKINHSNWQPAELQKCRKLTQGYNNIYLIDRSMTKLEVNSLLNCADCYVSLHRAEGFGLGLAEAMYLGKPVIGTNWSGNTDFMNSHNSCLVNYRLTQRGWDWGPYKAYQLWAEPDIHQASDLMRTLVNNPEWRNRIASNGQQTIRTEYSPLSAGERIKQRLLSLGLL